MSELHFPSPDFEKIAAMTEEERAAAAAAYAKDAEIFGAAFAEKQNAAESSAAELRAAKYEAAKYKLCADPALPGFAGRLGEIEALAAGGAVSGDLSDEERLRTAYYIDRGKCADSPDAEALLEKLKASPEAMRMAEAAILARLRAEQTGMPALSASGGGADLPLTPKAKPKTLSEAAALAREAFGI